MAKTKPPPRYRPGQKIRADQLEELVIWCKANGLWARCVRCDRDLGQCLREGDGPIEIIRRMINGKADRLVPVCKCSAPRRQAAGIPRPAVDGNGGNGAGGSNRLSKSERVMNVANRINWNAAPKGAKQRLWEIAAEIRQKGATWRTIMKELERRYGIKTNQATIASAVLRRRPELGGRRLRGDGHDGVGGSGDPPLHEDDGDIFDDGGSPPPGGPDPEDVDGETNGRTASGAQDGRSQAPRALQTATAIVPGSVADLAQRVLGTADAVEAGIRISIGPEPAHRMSLQRPGLRVEIEASSDEEFGDRARRLQAMLEIAKGT